ncbi:MAG: PAS domain S-box protein, partial [Thermomicrobiales bacterium]
MRAVAEGFVQACPYAIAGVTLDGMIAVWNPAVARLFGYTATEVIGQPLLAILPPEAGATVWEMLAQVRRGESPGDLETVRTTKDGRSFRVTLTFFPAYDAQQAIIGAFAAVRDSAEFTLTASEDEPSEHLFQAAFDDAPGGMALMALDGRILRVNRAACEIVGRPESELVGQNASILVPPEDVARSTSASLELIQGLRRTYRLDTSMTRPDGTTRWVHTQTSLIRDSAGTPRYFLGQTLDRTEEVRSQERLALARAEIQDTLNRAGGAVFELDAAWRITRANADAAQFAGTPPDALPGQRLHEVLGLGLVAQLTEVLERAMVERQASPVVEVFFPDSRRWFSARVDCVPDGVSLLLLDVTTLREVKERLHTAELRFETLAEQLPAGVYALAADARHSTIYYSRSLLQMLGYPPESPYPFTNDTAWLARVHPEDYGRVTQQLAELGYSSRQRHLLEYRMRRQDGEYIWVQDYHSPLRNSAGELTAWLGVIIDVTENRVANFERTRLAAIVEAAEFPIFTRTIEGCITYWNPAAERLYGYTRDEAIGQSLTILFPEEADTLTTNPQKLVEKGPERFDALHTRKDGSTVAVEVLIFPVLDESGTVLSMAGICQDVSGRKEADRVLRDALAAAEAGSRAKSLFLTMMSHELRTPLQAILGYAEFLLHDHLNPLTPVQREDVGLIFDGAQRMDRLVTQLLDLSRLQLDELHLQLATVEPGPLLVQVKAIIQARAQAHGLAVAISAPASLPAVLGDTERVREILLNLLDNAIKFTVTGGITIAAQAHETYVDIAVQDTGIGIAPDDLDHIFEEFRQAEDLLTRRHNGAGLGLTVARRLAEAMGGSITAQSTPGVGSTFTLRLPVAAGPDLPP